MMQCGGCEEEAEEREVVDRWTDGLSSVLAHHQGREALAAYLHQRDLYEDVTTLQWWQMCDRLQQLATAALAAPTRWERSEREAEYYRVWEEMVAVAEESINLDLEQLRQLYTGLSGGPSTGLCLLPAAQQTAARLLQPAYSAFRQHLLNTTRSRPRRC